MRPLGVVMDHGGLFVPSLDLALDPHQPGRMAFVSHAHGDHVAAVGEAGLVYGSPETLALIEARRGAKLDGARAIGWDDTLEMKLEGGETARLSIAPAGHVLGAAQ